jgi:phosphonate transport system substrate-binding protein
MRILLTMMVVMICILPGCKGSEVGTSANAPKVRQVVIGLIPEQNIFRQVDRYQPLADYLSAKLNLDIRLKVIPGYGNLINNFAYSGVDGAFFGSFTYALAHTKLGVEVLARPEYSGGTSTYHGLIFVRKNSGIRSVKDMRGKRFAFVDKSTTAGYLLPLEYFHEHGINNYRSYLKEVYYAGTHEDAIFDVLNGKADIGAAKNTILDKLAAEDGRIMGELRIIAKSPDVPENGLAVRTDLDASVKERLKKGLLDMDKTEEGRKILKQFGAVRFIETEDKDYEPVYKYAEEIGLDLKTFNVSEP